MTRTNTFYKIITNVSIFGLLALAISFGIILPTVHFIDKINKDTTELRIYLEKRYESVVRLRLTMRNFEEIKNTIGSFADYAFKIDNNDELNLITALEETAVKNNVKQKIRSTSSDETSEKFLSFSLESSGSYADILRYISDLEHIKFFLHIEQLQMTPAFNTNGEPSPLVNLYLNIILYIK